jgi:transcriptional regulator with XRE-family HTH domain
VSRDRQLAIFGHEVKRAREAKGWTKAELARHLGLKSPSAVSEWEAGRSGISEKRLRALEAALDRQGELGWIVGFGQPPTKAQPSIEAAIEADEDLTEEEKDWMLGGLAAIRRHAAKRKQGGQS